MGADCRGGAGPRPRTLSPSPPQRQQERRTARARISGCVWGRLWRAARTQVLGVRALELDNPRFLGVTHDSDPRVSLAGSTAAGERGDDCKQEWEQRKAHRAAASCCLRGRPARCESIDGDDARNCQPDPSGKTESRVLEACRRRTAAPGVTARALGKLKREVLVHDPGHPDNRHRLLPRSVGRGVTGTAPPRGTDIVNRQLRHRSFGSLARSATHQHRVRHEVCGPRGA